MKKRIAIVILSILFGVLGLTLVGCESTPSTPAAPPPPPAPVSADEQKARDFLTLITDKYHFGGAETQDIREWREACRNLPELWGMVADLQESHDWSVNPGKVRTVVDQTVLTFCPDVHTDKFAKDLEDLRAALKDEVDRQEQEDAWGW